MIGLLMVAPDANAQGYQFYPVGERAAGMGGAFTAIADDLSGAYYNPGGLAFAVNDSLSLSATFYGYTALEMSNAIGFGEAVSNMSITTFYAVPALSGSVYRFGAEAGRDAANVFAFSVVSPDSFSYRNQTKSADGRLVFSSRSSSQTYWFGPSFARRLGPHVGLGATLYGLFGQTAFDSRVSGRLTEDDLSILQDEMLLSSQYETDRKTFGLLALVGARFTWNAFHVGLVVRSPSLQVWGAGNYSNSYLVSYLGTAEEDTQQQDFTPLRRDPFMVGLGLGYERKRVWAVTADVKYYDALTYEDAQEDEIADKVKMRPLINGNLGFEYVVNRIVPLRAGFYTNFSPFEDARLDMYGVTVSAGLYREQTTFSLGLNYAWGTGTTPISRVIERDGQIATEEQDADLRVQMINLLVATSYRFD